MLCILSHENITSQTVYQRCSNESYKDRNSYRSENIAVTLKRRPYERINEKFLNLNVAFNTRIVSAI